MDQNSRSSPSGSSPVHVSLTNQPSGSSPGHVSLTNQTNVVRKASIGSKMPRKLGRSSSFSGVDSRLTHSVSVITNKAGILAPQPNTRVAKPRRQSSTTNQTTTGSPIGTTTLDAPPNQPKESVNETLKNLRTLRAISKRYERITERLENYWRIKVVVDMPDVSFHVVVDRRLPVNSLIHLIEAEYAYKFLLPPKAEGEDYMEVSYAIPLQCGLLHNSSMHALRFDDIIGDVLELDATVHALNVFEVSREASISQVLAENPHADDTEDVTSPLVTAYRRLSVSTPWHTESAQSCYPVIVEESDSSLNIAKSSSQPIQKELSVNNAVANQGMEVMSVVEIPGPNVSTATLQPQENPSSKTPQTPIDVETAEAAEEDDDDAMPPQEQAPENIQRIRDLALATAPLPNRTLTTTSAPTRAIGSKPRPSLDISPQSTVQRPTLAAAHTARPISFSMTNTTLDDRFQAVFRNHRSLHYFQEFCVEDHSIEHLLFWLEVETFQACPPIYQLIYARYIYCTYVAPLAPLKINVCNEVLNDVSYPTDGVDLDQMMFDEAQQHVYSILKGHSYVKFERSGKALLLLKERALDEAKFASGKFEKSLYEEMSPDMMFITRTAEKLAENMASTHTVQERDKVLESILKEYFPDSTYFPVENYFLDPTRVSRAQKRINIQKEKKISKFFGARPSFDQMQRQLVGKSQAQNDVSSTDLSIVGVEAVVSRRSSKQAEDDIEGGVVYEEGDKRGKVKKVGKLTEFFGQNIGDAELRRQKLAFQNQAFPEAGGSHGRESVEDMKPVDTVNELDPEEKRRIARQAKKIALLMGESLPEEYAAKMLADPKLRRAESLGQFDNNHSLIGKEAGTSGSADVDSDEFYEESLREILEMSEEITEDANKQTRRRRRLSKLSAVFGTAARLIESAEQEVMIKNQNIPTAKIPMTMEQKKSQMRKAMKLEKILGEIVPTDMLGDAVVQGNPEKDLLVPTPVNGSAPTSHNLLPAIGESEMENSLESLKHLPLPQRVHTEVPAIMLISPTSTDEIRTTELMPPARKGSMMRKPSVASLHHDNMVRISQILNGPDMEKALDVMDSMMDFEADLTLEGKGEAGGFGLERNNSAKTHRQKKLMKLTRFFGSKLNPVQLFEQNIFHGLEQMIEEDVTDPEELAQLRQDLAGLRKSVEDRKHDLRIALEKRALKDLEEAQSLRGKPQ